MRDTNSQKKVALTCAIGCMVLWAFLTLYWKALIPINSWVIIFYRIFLVFISSVIMARVNHSWQEIFAPARDRKKLRRFFLAGIVITCNWSVYIWAVNSGHVLQASIGYYMEPLAVCALGALIFHEKFNRYNVVALGFAIVAVIVILLHFRAVPGIALGLAVSFAIYSAIKKTVSESPLISLIYETVFLAPFALAVIIYLEITGRGAIGVGSLPQLGLLLLCGFVTAIPLAMFAKAAQNLSLFTVGLVEYVSPTISMLLGIFLFREPFDVVLLGAFALIWIGLIVFTYGGYKDNKALNKK